VGTGGSFPGGKAAEACVKLTTHLHLVPRSKNEWSYTSIPPVLSHGVVLSLKKALGQSNVFFTFTCALQGSAQLSLFPAPPVLRLCDLFH
jgi:hypothetical protein